MSGGSFDYRYFQIQQFAEDLQNKIDENDTKNEYGSSNSFNEKTLCLLKQAQRLIEHAGNIAKEVEWLYSGDIGEETFAKRFDELYSNE